MKFLHLGDLHLGKALCEYDLADDQRYMLDQILALIKKESVDGVLIAGDVYDKAIPSESATNLLDYFLCNLAKMGTKTFMISGNHDSDDRLNFGSTLFESNDIFISSVFDGMLAKKTVSDEYGEIDIYLLPFVKASVVKHFFPDAIIESYDDAVRTVIESAGVDPERRNVIIAHQFVTSDGAGDPVLGGSEGTATQTVGTVEKISYHCFDAFDYAALGHIHSPQRVGRDEVRYSGSMLKYSLSEASCEKTVPIITMGAKGDVKIELVPLRPMRDLRHIKGTMEELLDKNAIRNADDFIYVTLTNEESLGDVMGIFKQQYPNTVRIDFDNSHSRSIGEVDLSKIMGQKSFDELIFEFYKQIYGIDISEKEMEIMLEVAREAGVDQ